MITPDGAVVSNKLPVSEKRGASQFNKLGLFRGVVLGPIYTDDLINNNGEQIRYKIRVRGQVYINAIDGRATGGIFDYDEYVFKGPEVAQQRRSLDDHVYDALTDGEHVLVGFIEGNAEVPVIICGLPHPRSGTYKPNPVRADGRYRKSEFNGVEVTFDKDGGYTIKIVGKKNPQGAVLNGGAVGAEVSINGQTGDAQVKDSHGNVITLSDGNVTVTANGDVVVNAGGDANVIAGGAANVQAGGNAKVKGSQVQLESGSNSINGGVVTNNAVNNDPITGIPLTPCGGVVTQ